MVEVRQIACPRPDSGEWLGEWIAVGLDEAALDDIGDDHGRGERQKVAVGIAVRAGRCLRIGGGGATDVIGGAVAEPVGLPAVAESIGVDVSEIIDAGEVCAAEEVIDKVEAREPDERVELGVRSRRHPLLDVADLVARKPREAIGAGIGNGSNVGARHIGRKRVPIGIPRHGGVDELKGPRADAREAVVRRRRGEHEEIRCRSGLLRQGRNDDDACFRIPQPEISGGQFGCRTENGSKAASTNECPSNHEDVMMASPREDRGGGVSCLQ